MSKAEVNNIEAMLNIHSTVFTIILHNSHIYQVPLLPELTFSTFFGINSFPNNLAMCKMLTFFFPPSKGIQYSSLLAFNF